MNGITVPKQYRSELRDTRSKEYRIAEIRDYVKAHPDDVIKISDFMAMAGSNAVHLVPRLVKQGRLLRIPAKTPGAGVSYRYKWIEQRERVEETKHGEVKVTSLGFKDWPLGSEHTNKLMAKEMDAYIESNVETLDAENIKGMLLFKKHINTLYNQVSEQHKSILEGGQDEKN